jgi:hypothetical protein
MTEPNRQVALLPEPADMTPMQMLQIAVSKGVDTEQIKQLMELQREWKADKARDAFVRAMSDFRAEALSIEKKKRVSFGTTSYKHATLSQLVDIASPALSAHGLSHRWETKQEGGAITVTCIITHQLGHSEQCSLTAGADESGGKNKIQAIGSTVSYLQRYTFTAITGLAAKDVDDDGRGAEVINTDQATVITDKLAEAGSNKATFLGWLKAESIEKILVSDYQRAVEQLDKAIAKKAKK